MSIAAKTAHRRVAYLLLAFIGTHLMTHLSAVSGPETHSLLLGWGRSVYQVPILEFILIGAFFAQIFLGLMLVVPRIRMPGKGPWDYAQIGSGIYLLLFILLHSSAALMARYMIGVDTNFYWASGSLISGNLANFFAPYYFFAATAVFTHIAAALHFRGKSSGSRIALAVGPLVGLAILSVFGGLLYPITLPSEVIEYFATYTGQFL